MLSSGGKPGTDVSVTSATLYIAGAIFADVLNLSYSFSFGTSKNWYSSGFTLIRFLTKYLFFSTGVKLSWLVCPCSVSCWFSSDSKYSKISSVSF